jgi:hypothetical protein
MDVLCSKNLWMLKLENLVVIERTLTKCSLNFFMQYIWNSKGVEGACPHFILKIKNVIAKFLYLKNENFDIRNIII